MAIFRHVGVVTSSFNSTKNVLIKLFEMEVIAEYGSISGEYIDTLVGIDNVDMQVAILRMKDNTRVELLCYNQEERKPDQCLSSKLGVSHLAVTVDDVQQIYEKGLNLGLSFKSEPLWSPDKAVKVVYGVINQEILIEIVQVVKVEAQFTGGVT